MDKNICQNCGDTLTEDNKYMDGMCMECKCGIDWKDKDGLCISNTNVSIIKNIINPYDIFGKLTINHRECEDILSSAGSMVDKIAEEVQREPSNVEEFLNESSILKSLYIKISQGIIAMKEYEDSVKKYIEMLEGTENVNNVEGVEENGK